MRESAKARAACALYVAQPAGRRSLRRLAEELDRPDGYVRQLERWSAAFGWVDRAAAHDAKVLGEALDAKDSQRQLALADLQRGGPAAARLLLSVIEDESTTPVLDRQGKMVGTRPTIRASTKVVAAQHLLACIGVVPVQRLALEHLDAAPVDRAMAVIGRLGDAAIAVVREQIAAQRERQAEAGEQHPADDTEPGDDA